MKKGAWIIVLIGLGIGGWWGRASLPAPKVIPLPTPDIPRYLTIPKLGVNTEIEPVGKDKQGLMDVPKIVSNAGWYGLGVKPGEVGNAVIDGHLNNPQLQPEIFYRLETLTPGDEVVVTDAQQQKWRFKVVRVEKLPEKGFPIEEIFGPSDKVRLNLITCGGEWDKRLGTYDKRVVARTELTKN